MVHWEAKASLILSFVLNMLKTVLFASLEVYQEKYISGQVILVSLLMHIKKLLAQL